MSLSEELNDVVMQELIKANDNSCNTVNLKRLSALSCDDYMVGIDCMRYLDGLIYLPGALDLLLSGKCKEERQQIALVDAVGWFLRGYAKELQACGITSHLRRVWIDLLHRHDGETPTLESLFECIDKKSSRDNRSEYTVDIELNAIICLTKRDRSLFFDDVFVSWAASSDSIDHSLTIVDFSCRVATSTKFSSVYEDSVVTTALFKNGVTKTHLRICRQSLLERFGNENVSAIESMLAF